RSASFHSNHNHRSRNALLNLSRSSTPRPPNFFGRCTFFHCTRQCPPLACSVPFQRKPLLGLSICFIIHFCGWKAVRKYVGMDDRTMFKTVSLPALLRNFPFQAGNLLATLSTSGCTSTLRSFLVCRGSPK